jgi:hypothetical protein
MALNQAQQLALQQILESDTFKAAKDEVLRMTDGTLKDLMAPEAAIQMAIEKGVRNAFRLLHKISIPDAKQEPLQARSISRQHANRYP